MVKITHKPPELLQAQVAQFASETIADRDKKTYILENLAGISLGKVEDLKKKNEVRIAVQNEHDEWTIEPIALETDISTAQDYKDFLTREHQAGRSDLIKNRAKMLRDYKLFAPQVAKLVNYSQDIDSAVTDEAHYIGTGGYSKVFRINRNGKDYAVRIPYGKQASVNTIDKHTTAAILTDEQLSELIETLKRAHELGIRIDYNTRNLFYDKDAGFGLIDLGSIREAEGRGRLTSTLEQSIGEVSDSFEEVVWGQKWREEPKDSIRKLSSKIRRLKRRYRKIAKKSLTFRT